MFQLQFAFEIDEPRRAALTSLAAFITQRSMACRAVQCATGSSMLSLMCEAEETVHTVDLFFATSNLGLCTNSTDTSLLYGGCDVSQNHQSDGF